MGGIVGSFVEFRPSSPIGIIPDLVRMQALTSVQQPCSNPGKSIEMLGKVLSSECCHLQAFCTHLKTPANLRAALAWRRSRVRVSSGPLLFPLFAGKNLRESCRSRTLLVALCSNAARAETRTRLLHAPPSRASIVAFALG